MYPFDLFSEDFSFSELLFINIKELEQYGRRLCLRIESVPVVANKTSEDVFSNVLDMCKKVNFNISENDIDCAQRIGKPYVDNTSKKQCKSVILKFTSFESAHKHIAERKV